MDLNLIGRRRTGEHDDLVTHCEDHGHVHKIAKNILAFKSIFGNSKQNQRAAFQATFSEKQS